MDAIDRLVALLDAAAEPWTGTGIYRAEPATEASIARIEAELGLRVPTALVELSRRSPGFGVLFASLGEDWDCDGHILRLNAEFHHEQLEDGIRALPPHLVMFNRGHDCDCVCWDTSRPAKNGAYPVVVCCTDVGVRRRNGRVAFHRRLAITPAADSAVDWLEAECARLLEMVELG